MSAAQPTCPTAAPVIHRVLANAMAPRKPLTVSEWADNNRILSSKGSAEPGRWRTSRNPPLREPMDCMSVRSRVRDVVLKFPIQYGKSEVANNVLGYVMDHDPGPAMVCLPGEVSMNKWIAQKLNPMIQESPAVRAALESTRSRDSANQRNFKEFAGGQLYLEHAGSTQRLKSTSVCKLIVDELDEFASSLQGGDDPLDMLNGRTSAFPGNSRRMYISTPGVEGISRIDQLWQKSDQRFYHVPCPHCGEYQPLEWAGLHWDTNTTQCWYVCRECSAVIQEHEKTAMIAAGRWVATHPERKMRGYTVNCLYYQFGLGPRWLELAQMWREVQNDAPRLKTFVNDRLAETWEDPAMRAVRHNVIAERAEPYPLRQAPSPVLAVTAGVDTQDNRLACHIVGWGRRMASWTLDYIELPGDPADAAVWTMLVDLLNRPIERESGGMMRVMATAIDAGGHRTEAVKHFVRSQRIARPMCIFGATPNNAPVLSRGKLGDVTWNGKTDKRGIITYQVGTVAVKHALYGRLSTDAAKEDIGDRLVHFPEDLPPEFFLGMVSETYDPVKNRFIKRGGARNEPLDTYVYASAAAHHPELRLHRYTNADWLQLEVRAAAARKATEPAVVAAQQDARKQPAKTRRKTPPTGRGWGV